MKRYLKLFVLHSLLFSFLAVAPPALAESWPTLEKFVQKCVLIVKCKTDATDLNKHQVLETWKGNYAPELFDPAPPNGFLFADGSHGNVKPAPGREVIFFFTKQNQPETGKLRSHATAFPINSGKVVYAETSDFGRKEYTVDDFRLAILNSMTKQSLVDAGLPAERVATMSEVELLQELIKQLRQENPREKWTYAELSKQADTIVIATCIASTDFPFEKNKFQFPGDKERFEGVAPHNVGVTSKLKVIATLRGEVQSDEIEVLHLRYGPNFVNLGDIAFAVFETSVRTPAMNSVVIQGQTRTESPGEMVAVVPEYLVFLKRRDDGRFEAVSGQTHSAYSVRTLSGSMWPTVKRIDPDSK